MNKENCALKLVDEIILCYDARSKKHQSRYSCIFTARRDTSRIFRCVHTDPLDKISAIERVPATFSRMGVGVKAAET